MFTSRCSQVVNYPHEPILAVAVVLDVVQNVRGREGDEPKYV
jgi:hypothetical protein